MFSPLLQPGKIRFLRCTEPVMPDEYRPERSAATRSNLLVQLYVTIGASVLFVLAGIIKKTEFWLTVLPFARFISAKSDRFDLVLPAKSATAEQALRGKTETVGLIWLVAGSSCLRTTGEMIYFVTKKQPKWTFWKASP